MKRSRWFAMAAITLLVASLPALAQPGHGRGSPGSFQIRVGGFFPEGGGDVWSDNEDVFTLDSSDFNDATVGLTFLVPVTNYLEVGLNADFYDSTVGSAYRDFVDEDGFLIAHDTTLRMVPLTLDFRVLPGGRYGIRGSRGQRWVRQPVLYLGGGIGVNLWEYEEEGFFIDFFDPEMPVFYDRFKDSGAAFAAHALIGVEMPVSPGVNLLVEGRYLLSDDELGEDFAGLGTLKMDGPSVYVGASFHF